MFNNNKKESHIEANSPNASNIIGKNTTLEGNLNTAGNLRVEGKIVGNIHSTSKVVLGHTSTIEGNVLAQHLEVCGKVEGTIEVKELLTLKQTAVVNGDIIAAKLVFEEGASFNGKCNMNSAVKQTLSKATPTAPLKGKE